MTLTDFSGILENKTDSLDRARTTDRQHRILNMTRGRERISTGTYGVLATTQRDVSSPPAPPASLAGRRFPACCSGGRDSLGKIHTGRRTSVLSLLQTFVCACASDPQEGNRRRPAEQKGDCQVNQCSCISSHSSGAWLVAGAGHGCRGRAWWQRPGVEGVELLNVKSESQH